MIKAHRVDTRGHGFAPWRVVVWLVMLLSAAGLVLNGYACVVFVQAIAAMSAEAMAQADPRVALAWSLAYTVAALAIMVTALATLRWREWARQAMRILAVLLALWALYTAWVTFDQWRQLGAVLSQAGLPDDLLAVGQRQRNVLFIGLCMKAISVPVLAWLAWALGRPAVRDRFRHDGALVA